MKQNTLVLNLFNLVNEPLAKNIFKVLDYASKLKFNDLFFISRLF